MHRVTALLILLFVAGVGRASAAPVGAWGAEARVMGDTLRADTVLRRLQERPPPPRLVVHPPAPRAVSAQAPRRFAAHADTVPAPPAGTGLEIRVRGRGEMGGAWTRMRPCAGVSVVECSPGALPQMAPDLDLSVRAEGVVLDRWTLSMDYDEVRELQSANRFRLRYLGHEGELLRHLDVGDVRLDLPAFRSISSGLTGERFGAALSAGSGPLALQVAWAERRGSEGVREFVLDPEGAASERVEGEMEDAEYVQGQFYFLVDPGELPGHPHVDVLALTGVEVEDGGRPAGLAVHRYSGRDARDGSTPILTAGAGSGADAITLTGPFRTLEPGVDYEVHPSGLWLWLRSPLHAGEALAVTHSLAPEPTLLRAAGDDHRPGSPTWPFEMRQIYRMGHGEIDLRSLELELRDGAAAGDAALTVAHPRGEGYLPLLELFGLDRSSPSGRVDPERLWKPGLEGSAPLYLVLPTLRPFAEPAPLPIAGLTAAEAAAALGPRAVPAIYDAANVEDRRSGGRFRLRYAYAGTSHGTTPRLVSLGALGVREGSETVHLGQTRLRRGVDYDIRYETGQIELRGAAQQLAAGADARLRVSFEQDPVFGTPPARTVGFGGRYDLGEIGELRFLGVSERRGALAARPTVGAEGAGMLLGGVGGDLRLGVPWLDRLLRALREGTPVLSALEVSGELALSMPDPTAPALAFLDDFDEHRARSVPLLASEWRLGSAPASTTRAGPLAPPAFDAGTATGLVWQHAYLDGTGRVQGAVPAHDLDREMPARAGTREDALHLTFEGGRAGEGWRSVTTVLSASGTDLREYGYLEFYLRSDAGRHALLLDLGAVSEDAMAMDSLGNASGVHPDGRRWGEGVLDTQWDPRTEVWTEAHDDRPLWPTGCRAEPGRVYPLGDATANCPRGSGRPDTEDLDGNGRLDTDERVFRFLLPLDDPDHPYVVRDSVDTGTRYRLVRIPLHPDSAVGATVDDLRRVQHLRLTVMGGDPARITLARMRLVGSAWRHREETAVGRGLTATDTEPGDGWLEAGPVSRRSADDFVPPPGLGLPPRDGAPGDAVVEHAALSLRFGALAPDERAEVRRSFPGRAISFLPYQRLRLWALGRSGTWEAGGLELVLRVGAPGDGHYLYRAQRPRPAGAVRVADWEPEVVIDIERWLRLRAEVEGRLASAGHDGGDIVAWSADSTYALVLPAGGRMPNLAAVRELSIGVWNGGAATAEGELWVDHLRLEGSSGAAGVAGEASILLRGGDHFQLRLDHRARSGHFRDRADAPGFLGESGSGAELTADLGRFAPAGWGVNAPVRISLDRWSQAPVFLDGSDLRPELLEGLAAPGGRAARASLRLSRQRRSDSPAGRVLVDPLALHLRLHRGSETQTVHRRERSETDVTLSYDVQPAARVIPIPVTPLRWTPTRLGVRLRYLDLDDRRIRTDGTTGLGGAAGIREERRLGTDLTAGFRPLRSVDGSVALGGGRHLGPAGGSDRSLRTGLSWRPPLMDGVDASTDLRGRFSLRDLPSAQGLPHGARGGFDNGRELAMRIRMDPERTVRAATGRDELAEIARRVAFLEVDRRLSLDSRFDRSDATPGWRYHLALESADSVRRIGADSAAAVASGDRWEARGRIRLGAGLDLDLSHTRRDAEVWSRWGARSERERTWPSAMLEWQVPPPWGWQNLSLGAGYTASRIQRIDIASAQRREESEVRIPLRISVAPAAGWRVAYRLDWRDQDRLWSGNHTRRTVLDHALSGSVRFSAPAVLRGMTEPVEVALDYRAGDRRDCRLAERWLPCAPGSLFQAERTHTLGVRASAGSSAGRLGLHLDFDDRASRAGVPAGRGRLSVGLFGQFTMDARAGAALPGRGGEVPLR